MNLFIIASFQQRITNKLSSSTNELVNLFINYLIVFKEELMTKLL